MDQPLLRRVARVGLPLVLAIVALTFSMLTQRLETKGKTPFPLVKTQQFHPSITLQSADFGAVVAADEALTVPVEVALRRGQTLGELLADFGLPDADSQQVLGELSRHVDVRRLRAGDPLSVYLDPQSRVTGLELTVGDRGVVTVATRDGGEWAGRFEGFEKHRVLRAISGEVQGSFGASVERAGASPNLAYRMADVLRWDMDFNRDVQPGDRFEVLFEEVQIAGRGSSLGAVVAARYENKGKWLEAFRYGDDGAYFDAEGRPLEKMFLRSPLPFTRVTSRFSNRRFHPVLKIYRPHYGVDYGAPVGTPVQVTAAGTVTFAGWDRGGGKTVKVRHANGYVTAYLHLSGFAKEIRSGARVSQGQVIGFVGATGLASGPHLDYRVQYNGQWIDPLGLKSVQAEAVQRSDMATFAAWRDRLRATLVSREVPADLLAGDLQLAVETTPAPSAPQVSAR